MTSTTQPNIERELLDDDGENRAVRTFLMLYGGADSVTVAQMGQHMNRSGWPSEYWPDFARQVDNAAKHLTKAGAQIWIRHLFDMEPARAAQATAEPVVCGACHGSGWVVRDEGIGTDQECFSCGGSGVYDDAAPDRAPSADSAASLLREHIIDVAGDFLAQGEMMKFEDALDAAIAASAPQQKEDRPPYDQRRFERE